MAQIIRSMAIRKTAEQRLWCGVLCRAVKDTWTQNCDPDFWEDGRGEFMAEICGLDVSMVRKWAGRVGLEL